MFSIAPNPHPAHNSSDLFKKGKKVPAFPHKRKAKKKKKKKNHVQMWKENTASLIPKTYDWHKCFKNG